MEKSEVEWRRIEESGEKRRRVEEEEEKDGVTNSEEEVDDEEARRGDEGDVDEEVMQIFVKTDEGRTSALQVTSRDTIGEIVQRACGRRVVDEGGWYVQCQGRMSRSRDTTGSCRVENGDMLQLTRRICGGGRNKNRKRSAKKERTERRVDHEEEEVESIVMDPAQAKEDSELNETRISRMLRERSKADIERLIKALVNWSKESLGVSDEIEEGIRKMLERFQHERPAQEGDIRKGHKEGRGCASLVQGGGRI